MLKMNKKMKLIGFMQFADSTLRDQVEIDKFVKKVEFKIMNTRIKEYIPSSHFIFKKT